jgi:hypothetical protein
VKTENKKVVKGSNFKANGALVGSLNEPLSFKGLKCTIILQGSRRIGTKVVTILFFGKHLWFLLI